MKNELRLGNYLQDRNGKLAIVEELSKEGIKAYSGIVTGLPLSPIPLNEEWLNKFGFEKSFGDYWMESNSGFYFGISSNGELMYLFDEEMICPANIKYVHQLQNLFFALTGKELELRPTAA